jgi:hypothetical protein
MLTAGRYDILTDPESRMHWYCFDCEENAVVAVKTDNQIEEKCAKYFAKEGEVLANAIAKVKDDLEEYKAAQEIRFTELEAKHQNSTAQAASLGANEMRAREERKLNLIFFNIPEEDTDPDDENRAQADEDFIKHLFQEVLKVQARFSDITRLGSKSGEARPIRIKTNSNPDMMKILKSTKVLSNRGNEAYANIIIKKDMTPLEREERRNLVKLKKQKQEAAQRAGRKENWVIRGTRLIDVERNRNPAANQSEQAASQLDQAAVNQGD